MSDDILILVSRSGATVSGLNDRGKRWIHSNMTEDSPCWVDPEGVDEIETLIERDGLTVRRR